MAPNKPAPTAAEEQLAQRDQEQTDTLAETAADEKSEQKEELKAGRKSLVSSADLGEEPAAQHRSDHVQLYTKTSGNRPDQYTVTNPREEPFYGHFVTVTGGDHEGLYGVYTDNVSFKENGQPDVVIVRSSGDAVVNYQVKYDDLAPAQSRGNGAR